MQARGVAGDVPITIVRGPYEYLSGQEKALLEVIEGHAPFPACSRPSSTGCSRPPPQT
jgi:NADH:ubiquinone oxidoreductase subunit F (NADH-binding)